MPDAFKGIYTIGHGRHPFAYFLELLKMFEVEFVCDVRSVARSRWPQFNGLFFGVVLEHGMAMSICLRPAVKRG